ncbi:hypothetical protein L6452_30976 [Arctium lappa]|uniref:Uncharacterized protein n=1 Tax=Arctium lappa TaxID=4217 RepID=A0ACB8ZJ73_ARCLA|nr:hypothetical protein L6452_30976 [Arctium lappa]
MGYFSDDDDKKIKELKMENQNLTSLVDYYTKRSKRYKDERKLLREEVSALKKINEDLLKQTSGLSEDKVISLETENTELKNKIFDLEYQIIQIQQQASVEIKRIFRYLKATADLGMWYPEDTGFVLMAYSDADHAGCMLDRKSTLGYIQFLGDKLLSWVSKKQLCVSTSTAEVEYVAATSCCSQVLWMRTQLRDYGFKFDKIPIYCDSKSAIAISTNSVQHTKTKHIDVRYHFIKVNVEKGTIELYFVNPDYQLADLPLDEKRFNFLISKIVLRGSLHDHIKYDLELTL